MVIGGQLLQMRVDRGRKAVFDRDGDIAFALAETCRGKRGFHSSTNKAGILAFDVDEVRVRDREAERLLEDRFQISAGCHDLAR